MRARTAMLACVAAVTLVSAHAGVAADAPAATAVATVSGAATGSTTRRVVDPTFEKWCVHCHRAGLYMAGTAGLAAKYRGTPVSPLLEERTDLTPAVVKNYVRHGSNSMAPFRKTEIGDAELDALARYLARQP